MTGIFPSILITDDDQGFRETLEGMLRPQGFTTFTASDGRDALEIVRQREVHLVLLDMHMPRLTGIETIRRVKRLNAHLPCVLLSAAADRDLVEQAHLVDAFRVLQKPVSGRRLSAVVRSALRHAYDWPQLLPGPMA